MRQNQNLKFEVMHFQDRDRWDTQGMNMSKLVKIKITGSGFREEVKKKYRRSKKTSHLYNTRPNSNSCTKTDNINITITWMKLSIQNRSDP